jgi:predicted nucleic acid-binding protein
LLVLPAPVSAEVDYLLRQRGGKRAGRLFLEDLAVARFSVESLTVAEYRLALELHDRYSDLNLGLADLSVVALAHRHRTRRLLTFDDRDFRAVTALDGTAFILLPADL